jgi:glutamate 5-kinase
LVSSGAVGAGKKSIRQYKGTLVQKKAAAAIGNPILMTMYGEAFAQHGMAVAQTLCERGHFANRNQFLQLKATLQELWTSGVVPIANENDVVSDVELKFSDNDELATLLAAGLGAEILMLGTSVGAFLDGEGNRVPRLARIDKEVWAMVRKEKSSLGSGGMVSKLSFARRASQLGIPVVLFSASQPNGIQKALDGETGTWIDAAQVSRNERQRWLGTGSLISGKAHLDAGARAAVSERKSLLAVGILAVQGDFEVGEVIELLGPEGETFAIARTRLSKTELESLIGTPKMEVAHTDDIVVL